MTRKLLIAHEQTFDRQWLRAQVESCAVGWTVAGEADNGRLLLDLIESQDPDLIISQLRLPGLDGKGLAEHLCEEDGARLLVLLTDDEDAGRAEVAWSCGTFGLLMKPYNREGVYRVLREAYVSAAARAAMEPSADSGASNADAEASPGEYPPEADDWRGRWNSYMESGNAEQWRREADTAVQELQMLPPAEAKLQALRLLTAVHSLRRRELGEQAAELDMEHFLEQMQELQTTGEIVLWCGTLIRGWLKPPRSRRPEHNRSVIPRAVAYLEQHYMESCSAAELAGRFHMSSAYFSKLFKKEQGVTFSAYLTGLRIERAKQLLTETDLRVSEVAHAVGYDDPNYFANVFRDTQGTTPSEFRRTRQMTSAYGGADLSAKPLYRELQTVPE